MPKQPNVHRGQPQEIPLCVCIVFHGKIGCDKSDNISCNDDRKVNGKNDFERSQIAFNWPTESEQISVRVHTRRTAEMRVNHIHTHTAIAAHEWQCAPQWKLAWN